MSTQNDVPFGTIQKGTCKGQFKYKINTYSHDGLAVAIAVLKYRRETIGLDMPLIKQAYSQRYCRCETMMYFTTANQAYTMWELLKFCGKKYSHDSTLVRHDWQLCQTTVIDSMSCHPRTLLEDGSYQ